MRQRHRNQWRLLRDHRRTQRRRVTHQGPDLDHAVVERNCVQSGNAVDVHKQFRRVEPHIERCDQALPTREHPRTLVIGEKRNGVIERARLGIGKWRRFHCLHPPRSLHATDEILGKECAAVNVNKRRRNALSCAKRDPNAQSEDLATC
jgi:hypothetical protein